MEEWEKKNPTCDGLIKAFLKKKERNAYCTYSESLNSTRSASFSLKREFKKKKKKNSLLEEDTQRYKKKKRKKEEREEGVCVCICV